MKYLITAKDGEGMLERRMEVRPRHLENIRKYLDRTVVAGGLLDEEGRAKGSVLVMDFETKEDLDAYLASEPYIQERVWETVDIEPMNVVLLDGKKVGN